MTLKHLFISHSPRRFIDEGVNCGQRSVVDKHSVKLVLNEAVCGEQVPTCKEVHKGVSFWAYSYVYPLMTALGLQLMINGY